MNPMFIWAITESLTETFPKDGAQLALGVKNFQCFQTGGTNSIDIVGDTLYNANWENLLKFPLDKLDSAIADGNDFHWN